jgi:hypothetical protein
LAQERDALIQKTQMHDGILGYLDSILAASG